MCGKELEYIKNTEMRRLFSIFFLLVVLVSCISTEEGVETVFDAEAGVEASSSETPLVLKLAVNDIYCAQTACSCISYIAYREYEDFLALLKKKYNIELRLTYYIEEYDLKDAVLSGEYDGVICKPWLAFIHTENNFDFKRIVDIPDVNGNRWLSGMIIVDSDSDIKDISELTGKRFVTSYPDNYEKYHMGMHLLSENGVEPLEIISKASCMETVNCLLDGEADAGIISDYALEASCVVDIAKPEDFRVIVRTENIPLTSLILDMNKVSTADALRLQEALLKISKEGLPVSLACEGFLKPLSWKVNPYKN
jgi:ABC-type phosphate/phosphonate transport system, periplasmic component